ncbi:MAG: M24 family metallopeptidase, partial [Pseudomonadota bacterium]
IGACRPGEHFNAPHEAAVRAPGRGRGKRGLGEGDVGEIRADESYKSFCPHKTSHWLGIDVHDVGDYRIDERWRDFEPGMVLTIEPGIYIPTDESTTHLPAKYRGIGVRIEDDVLIGKQGPEVLTEDVPKDIDAIETLMAEAVA